jgi:Holliday junction DNA helicase RuvA
MQATKAIEQAANTLGADAETEALIRQALKMMVAG